MKSTINEAKHETPMKRVLVAGATGYLGGFVAQELKARGHFVRALARSPQKLEGIRGSLDEAVKAEVTRPETLAQVCKGIDVVISSVGITRQKDGMTFSDMGEMLEMARRGRVWLIGSGKSRVNPIHGSDLAVSCADAIEGAEGQIEVGGPETMTWEEVADLAFGVCGKPVKVTRIPEALMWWVVRLVRLFSRHQGELLAFFTTMATTDVVAPSSGTHILGDHFHQLGGP